MTLLFQLRPTTTLWEILHGGLSCLARVILENWYQDVRRSAAGYYAVLNVYNDVYMIICFVHGVWMSLMANIACDACSIAYHPDKLFGVKACIIYVFGLVTVKLSYIMNN